MARKCKNCGHDIIKVDGRWKDLTGILPYKCYGIYTTHEPEDKKAVCKKCGCEIVKIDGIWKDPLSHVAQASCQYWHDPHIPKKKKEKVVKCENCGREIEKGLHGFWKDYTSVFPYQCGDLFHNHIPKKKKEKAVCKWCGRKIKKSGENWKDNSGTLEKYCFADAPGLLIPHKHEPAE